MKKVFSIFLVLVLTLSMAMPVFASEQISDQTGTKEQTDLMISEYLTDIPVNTRATAKGANPPSSSNVWDWSKGTYSGSFTMKERVFTNYMFNGYSSYTISANVTCSVAANKSISIQVYNENKKLITSCSYKDRTDCSLTVSNLSAGTKIYVAVAHDYDGFEATGIVRVSHG